MIKQGIVTKYREIAFSFGQQVIAVRLGKYTNCPCVGGGVLPSKRLVGMCRWMGSHLYNWTDYNGAPFFGRVTKMGSHIFGISGIRKLW